jgi:hypothetical protein
MRLEKGMEESIRPNNAGKRSVRLDQRLLDAELPQIMDWTHSKAHLMPSLQTSYLT